VEDAAAVEDAAEAGDAYLLLGAHCLMLYARVWRGTYVRILPLDLQNYRA
jgi:hypothetical protein